MITQCKECSILKGITDVPGILVGQQSDLEGLTGCTVVLCKDGAVVGVDVRGSAPGTRETDLMRPCNMVERAHGILLAGEVLSGSTRPRELSNTSKNSTWDWTSAAPRCR